MDMSDGEINPRYYTRSQAARAKSQVMDDIVPEDSVSQENNSTQRTSSHVSSSTHSTSSRKSYRNKEQLDLDISSLAIKMNSQQRRAQLQRDKLELEKRKLDVELEMEKNELQEEMDLAKNERESLDRECSDSSLMDITTVRTPEQIRNPLNEEIQKMLNDCYTFLGSGKVDLNGAKACRVYMPPNKSANKTKLLQKSAETEKMNPKHVPASKIPRTSTVKKETENLAKYAEPISTVRSQKVETVPRLVTVTRRLPEEEYDYNPFPLKKESAIGYFPSPKPDDRDRERSDKALGGPVSSTDNDDGCLTSTEDRTDGVSW